MSRYVNLDEEIKAMYFDEEHEEWNLKEETIESALNHVDCYNVFELVRCKDCKWWTQVNNSLQGRCGLLLMYPTREWYCANAERKEE